MIYILGSKITKFYRKYHAYLMDFVLNNSQFNYCMHGAVNILQSIFYYGIKLCCYKIDFFYYFSTYHGSKGSSCNDDTPVLEMGVKAFVTPIQMLYY